MLDKFLKAFVSAGTAITLLVLLGAVLIFSTIYESQFGTAAVQHLVYKTWWFLGLLGLIFLNVLFASLVRLPFKKEQTGFHITHIGLLIILFGAMLTCVVGREGRLGLQEGEKGESFVTDMEQVAFWPEGAQQATIIERQFSPQIRKHPWKKVLDGGPVELAIDDYAPDSRLEVSYGSDGDNYNPMAEISFAGSMGKQTAWIAPGGEMQVGPAQIRFEEISDPKKFQALLNPPKPQAVKAQGKGELVIQLPGQSKPARFSIEDILKKEIKIPGSALSVKGIQYYPYALVEGSQLVNHSDDPVNPAIEFEVRGPKGVERHVAFSLFPQFASLHGKTSKNYGIEARFEAEGARPPSPNTLTIFRDPSGKMICQITNKAGETRALELSLKNPIETGWMDFKFELKNFFEKAKERTRVVPLQTKGMTPNGTPALHFTLINAATNARSQVWVQKESGSTLPVGEDLFHLHYNSKEIPLGFSLLLKDFVLKNYPGTDNPMSYESFVEVEDPKNGKVFPAHIYMNHPLVYKGYKFFQSSYIQNPGEPEVSIFSIKKDPGIPLIYGGSIILVLGILLLFFGEKKTGRASAHGRPVKGKK